MWYRANKICGVALLVVGMFWLVLAVVLPKIITPTWVAYGVAQWLGIASLAVALLRPGGSSTQLLVTVQV